MALRTCSECASQVSSYAAACPKCGYPIGPLPKMKVELETVGCMAALNIGVGVFFGVILGAIILYLFVPSILLFIASLFGHTLGA